MSRNRAVRTPEPFLILTGFHECERCRATTDDQVEILQLTGCGIAVDCPWLCAACARMHRVRCPICRQVRARSVA